MNELIRIQPARHLRQEFARWAVAQRPKVGTVSESAFGVPPRLFTDMPEDLLRGALVDGHAYVPVDDEPSPPAPAGAPELLGVATLDGLREAVPGHPLPEVPASSYGPDSVPLPPPDFAPLEDAPTPEEGEPYDVGDPEGDAAAMVAATSPALIERAMAGALLATDLAASNAARNGDTAGDSDGDALAGGETTAADTEAVTSEDTAGDEGDTVGDGEGDTPADGGQAAKPYPCPRCSRSFTTGRGREVHLSRVHS
ncbi:hypothetical protein QEH48_gp019 [Streptomyces phage TurkishDelight]|uniref:C2H2-type domain-containing protein n=1 Tax=Streptomyces phage TurkishDelight TaxID=2793708 RepID=A0A7T0Q3N6_9CAUD|nr:hypothetical protein QEH48_gp019 [Streptomyces phage TurkishDelight]QPL14048.1 hypothetical protein SEA_TURKISHDELIGHT_19 [Streptomyces phage TurkishDelight]